MYSQELTKELNTGVKETGREISLLCSRPLIKSAEEAAAFGRGLKALSEMPLETLEKLQKEKINEVVANYGDQDEKIALYFCSKALQEVNDAVLGVEKDYYDPEKAKKTKGQKAKDQNGKRSDKSSHGENHYSQNMGVQRIRRTQALLANDVDAGYLPVFRNIDARGSRTLLMEDLILDVRFEEIAKMEEPVLSGTGDVRKQELSGRFFGGGFMMYEPDMPFSPVTANERLTALRIASQQTRSHVAFKEIFLERSDELTQSFIQHHTTATGPREIHWQQIMNIRYTLNEAARQLINQATQVTAGNKRNKNRTESPLRINVRTPIIVMYNHAHMQIMNHVQRMSIGAEDRLNVALDYNFGFMGTHQAPVSGAWKSIDETKKDEFGVYGTVKESGLKNTLGVKLVIPGVYNIAPTYEDLRFAQDRRATTSTTLLVARERYGFHVDNRQTMKVELG